MMIMKEQSLFLNFINKKHMIKEDNNCMQWLV